MSDPTGSPDDPGPSDAGDDAAETEEHEPIPDESTLMGVSGVEAEVLAELARAEGEMSDPSAPDNPDAEGAEV
jgi:hypothetical protein